MTEDKIEDRTGQPDGQVVDTSELSQLPNTGGPNLTTGGALIAGLTLLSAGVGVSVCLAISTQAVCGRYLRGGR